MLIRINNKLKDNKGSDKGIILTGLVISFALIFYLIMSRSNQILTNEVNSFMEGLEKGSKAALMQISKDEENLENIATGYIMLESNVQAGYNHQLKLDHGKSSNIALKMLADKTGFSMQALKKHFKTVIIETQRQEGSINNYRLVSTFYDMSTANSFARTPSTYFNFTNTNAVKNEFKEIENWINNILKTGYDSNMSIRLSGIESGFARDMEVKTYFLAIIDGFNPDERLSAFYQGEDNKHRLINIYYFEGSNLMRSTDFRTKQ